MCVFYVCASTTFFARQWTPYKHQQISRKKEVLRLKVNSRGSAAEVCSILSRPSVERSLLTSYSCTSYEAETLLLTNSRIVDGGARSTLWPLFQCIF